MFDELYCEAGLPAGLPDDESAFQTKSLFSCLDTFTITKEGRLIHHPSRFEPSGDDSDQWPRLTRIPLEDVDTEFHGDIRLTSTVKDQHLEYGDRFTHGQLEWIRPWSDLSELHRSLFKY